MQKLMFLVISIFGLFSLCFAEDSITITTYYPSPYGSYKNLNVYNQDESGTQTDFTQAVTKAGLLITTDYTDTAYTPGVFWSTTNDNSTKPKAGIYLKETAAGTNMYFGTSNAYATGITNNAIVIDSSGNVGIGTTAPNGKLEVTGRLALSDGGGASRVSLNLESNTTATSYSAINSYNYGTSSPRSLSINESGGNVGIGTTSPARILDIDRNAANEYVRIGTDSRAYYFGLGNSGGDDQFGIWDETAGATRFLINTSGYISMPGGYGDLGENYQISGTVLRGGLVSVNNTLAKTAIASSLTQLSLIGVVSTKPGAVMDVDGGFQVGSDTKPTYTHEKAPIALVGAVPTLVTSQNGSINMGDAIGISNISGFGAKMITAGNIVGKALEKLETGNACQTASSIKSIVWPEDDGKNSKKPCFKLPDGTYVGKIMVAVNVSWYDPEAEVSNSNERLVKEMRTNVSNLLETVKEQQNIIKAQQLEIDGLKARLDKLERKQTQSGKST